MSPRGPLTVEELSELFEGRTRFVELLAEREDPLRAAPGGVAGGLAGVTPARRAIGNLAQRIPGGTQSNVTGGVSVEKGERETAIDISVVVEYGAAIVTVSEQIRENVISAVEFGTGLDVVAVNVNVTDVHLPDDDATSDSSSSDELR